MSEFVTVHNVGWPEGDCCGACGKHRAEHDWHGFCETASSDDVSRSAGSGVTGGQGTTPEVSPERGGGSTPRDWPTPDPIAAILAVPCPLLHDGGHPDTRCTMIHDIGGDTERGFCAPRIRAALVRR